MANFAGGTGTKEDPYLISNREELNMVREYLSDYFKQINDIDLDGEPWLPIGFIEGSPSENFIGGYDGGGYSITNMENDYSNEGVDGGGLFYQIADGAVIKNIIFKNIRLRSYGDSIGIIASVSSGNILPQIKNISAENIEVRSDNYIAGGLIGIAWSGNFEQCHISFGEIEGSIVGGIAGQVWGWGEEDEKVSLCSSKGNITGSEYAGGIIGEGSAIINDCFSKAIVSAPWSGGLCSGYEGQSIKNSYFAGVLNQGATEVAPIALDLGAASNFIIDCYYDEEKIGVAKENLILNGANSKTTEEMKQIETFENWDIGEVK